MLGDFYGSFQFSSVVLHLKCSMARWRELTIPGEPVWATVVFTATSCPLLPCWPAREMARGRETYRSVCVSWPTVASCTGRGTSSHSCHGFLQRLDCVCVTEAVLCGDPGSPGGGYREGNIFSYRSVVACYRCCCSGAACWVDAARLQSYYDCDGDFYNSSVNLKKKMLIPNACCVNQHTKYWLGNKLHKVDSGFLFAPISGCRKIASTKKRFVSMKNNARAKCFYNPVYLIPPAGQRSASIARLLTCWWAQSPESVKAMGFGADNNLPV